MSSLRSLSQVWNKKKDENDGEVDANDTKGSVVDSSASNSSMMLRSRNVLSSINLNVSNVPKETRKLLQAGAQKVNQTISSVCVSFGVLSQRLKNPSRRRQRLVNSSPYTPGAKGQCPDTRKLLGRTPTKLYSPFGIETPTDRQRKPREQSRKLAVAVSDVYSPTQAFPNDVRNLRKGVADFDRAAQGAVRRSLRKQILAAAADN